jgi:hypothetical protein
MLTFYCNRFISVNMTDKTTLTFERIKAMTRDQFREQNNPAYWVLWDCLHMDPEDVNLVYTALCNVTKPRELEKEIGTALMCIQAWKSEYVDEASQGGMHHLAYLYLSYFYKTSFRLVEIEAIPDDIIERIVPLHDSKELQDFVGFVKTTTRKMKERSHF